jgi:hypothetical protein
MRATQRSPTLFHFISLMPQDLGGEGRLPTCGRCVTALLAEEEPDFRTSGIGRHRAGARIGAAVISHVIDAWPLWAPLAVGILVVLTIAVRQAR